MDSPSQVDPRIGLVLNDRYRVVELLGEGGMGVVYRGRRLELDRPVAIKFLHSPYAGSPKFRARFDREARAMSRLSHPCCVSVIDFGVDDAPYIVMDFAPGQTLRAVLDEQHLPPARAIQIARQILTGLAHAHEQGIIHRDIKPGNVMLGEAIGLGDHVRIFDFGLAKLHEPSGAGDPSTTGVIGTPSYMAPEQTRGDKLDARVDLYATGVVLFEMLVGEKPFDAPDTMAVLRMHRDVPAPSLSSVGVDVSPELEAMVAKALQKDPHDRFQTAAEFLEALDALPEATGRPSAKAVVEAAFAPTEMVTSPRISPSRGDTTSDAEPRAKRTGLWLSFIGLWLVALGAWALLRPIANQPGSAARAAAPAPIPRVVAPSTGRGPTTLPPLPKPGLTPAPDAAAPGTDAGASVWAVSDAGVYEISEEDVEAADLALNDPTDSEAAASPDEASDVRSLADVRALIRTGKVVEAIAGVRALRRREPRNAELPYLLGDLYFEKGYWSDALSRYREALRLNANLKRRASVQLNAIAALGADKTHARARAVLVRDLGSRVISRLRVAHKHDPSRIVRARAGSVLAQLTGKSTRRTKKKKSRWSSFFR